MFLATSFWKKMSKHNFAPHLLDPLPLNATIAALDVHGKI
jgi:hypothetical protein